MANIDDMKIDIVFADANGGRDQMFVEVEVGGKSIRFGEWVERLDGLRAIRFGKKDVEALEKFVEENGD